MAFVDRLVKLRDELRSEVRKQEKRAELDRVLGEYYARNMSTGLIPNNLFDELYVESEEDAVDLRPLLTKESPSFRIEWGMDGDKLDLIIRNVNGVYVQSILLTGSSDNLSTRSGNRLTPTRGDIHMKLMGDLNGGLVRVFVRSNDAYLFVGDLKLPLLESSENARNINIIYCCCLYN